MKLWPAVWLLARHRDLFPTILPCLLVVCWIGLGVLEPGCARVRPATPAGPTNSNLAEETVQDPAHIRVSQDGRHFVLAGSGSEFRPWGFNYDHDAANRLLEDYWTEEWPAVEGDFAEMKALGANTVRIHLQVAKFMKSPHEANPESLVQLGRLLTLAERTGLYLDITGLGCYKKEDVPRWYNDCEEARRWDVQARFWAAVAQTCSRSRSVFCYGLMNEPVVTED